MYKLNLDKTKLLFLPGKESPFQDLSINIEQSVVSQLGLQGTWLWHWMTSCLHHGNNPLLQIHSPQHQEDMSVPHPGGGAGSRLGSCHLSYPSSPTLLLCSLHWLPVTGAQLVLNKMTTVSCPGSTMVERASHWHWDSWTHIPSQTENPSVQTAPWPINMIKKPNKPKNLYLFSKCSTWSIMKQLSLFEEFDVLAWFLHFLGRIQMVECTCKSLWIKASVKLMNGIDRCWTSFL